VRGSRRSFATHPRRDAPDASRSRQAPVRTSGGTSIQPVVADSGESPTPRLDRLPRGSPSPMEVLRLSTDPPAAPRLTPRIAPGRSPNAPFGQRLARRLSRRLSDPPHCAGKKADRPEGKSSRKTLDPHTGRLPHERTRTGGGRRRTIGAPCGRQSPADCTERPRRSSLSRSPPGCTEVQPREPKHSAIRRSRVPSLV